MTTTARELLPPAHRRERAPCPAALCHRTSTSGKHSFNGGPRPARPRTDQDRRRLHRRSDAPQQVIQPIGRSSTGCSTSGKRAPSECLSCSHQERLSPSRPHPIRGRTKTRDIPACQEFNLAGVAGFEPAMTEPKSVACRLATLQTCARRCLRDGAAAHETINYCPKPPNVKVRSRAYPELQSGSRRQSREATSARRARIRA